MNLFKPSKTELVSFLVLMPLVAFISIYVMFNETIWRKWNALLIVLMTIFAFGTITFLLNTYTSNKLQQSLPELKQTVKRVTLIAFLHIAISVLLFILLFNLVNVFSLWGVRPDMQNLKLALWIMVGFIMLSDTLWESEFIYKRYKESIIEKEAMQQLSIQQEFDTLKSQVNPHFLFNCFNTLSSLISEDKIQAENFLNELSKVYRYLLRNNEDSLSTLQDELAFIKSYYKLLKTRHGDAIDLQIEIEKKYYKYLLPSLSLQLLVENAVKHNVISKHQPLVIDIFSIEGNKIAVNNNLQAKKIKLASSKIGLSNIRSKYELLGQQGYEILQDARNFTVILPLIWNNTSEMQFSFIQKSNNTINLN